MPARDAIFVTVLAKSLTLKQGAGAWHDHEPCRAACKIVSTKQLFAFAPICSRQRDGGPYQEAARRLMAVAEVINDGRERLGLVESSRRVVGQRRLGQLELTYVGASREGQGHLFADLFLSLIIKGLRLRQKPLSGLNVLVVEDEFLIAQLLCDDLGRMGATVIGPFSQIAPAMERIASGESIQAAILDINISGREVYPLADELAERGVHVVFLTGLTKAQLPERFASIRVFSKEAPIDDLVFALS